jgi:hypothetical protein
MTGPTAPPFTRSSKELEMLLLHENLARERMREHERSVHEAHQRLQLQRLAQARRWQRRAESASRRARALLLSL